MSVLSCLSSLLKQGKINQTQHDDARAIYHGMLNDDLFRNMDQAAREAHAALSTAKILGDQAKAQKLELARRTAVYNDNLDRIKAHPDGPIAGFMALYDRDIRNRPGDRLNVTSLQRDHYEPMIAAKMHTMDSAYRSTMGGLKQDRFGIRTMIRELFGVKTGDKTAADAAAGWKAATDYAVKQARHLGRAFETDDDWRLPQFWDSARANKFGPAEWKGDLQKHIDAGGVKIFDPKTGLIADTAARDGILTDAIKHIQEDLSRPQAFGTSSVFKQESRVIRFTDGEAGAGAYLSMMDKYGVGQGRYYAMMQDHAHSMARELSLYHVMGPKPGAMGDKLLQDAREGQANLNRVRSNAAKHDIPLPEGVGARTLGQTIGDRLLSGTGIENDTIAERLNDYMLGRLSGVGNRVIAGVLAGFRGFLTSANLGGALISAVPGDTVNVAMAAGFRGLDAGRIVADIGKEFLRHDPDREALAVKLGLVSHAATRTAISEKQFGDQLFGTGKMQGAADFVMRAQRLHHWDSAIATAFPMEFMASIGDRAGKSWDALDAPFQQFLTDYGFKPAEWETIANAQMLPAGGAKYLMPDSLEGDLRAKLMSAVGDEKQFAYLAGGSNRVRAMTASGAKAGTLAGEASRALFMFKTFPMSMIMTHGIRAAQEASQGRMGQAAQLVIGMTLAGAVAVEAKQVLQGKDPQSMESKSFWAQAALQGGALGIYGDFLKDTFSRTGTGLGETLLGPFGEFPAAIGELGGAVTRSAEDGKPLNVGAALARDVGRFTPGGSLWYGRLIFQRTIVDNIQRMLDPSYARSFARAQQRAQKLTGQNFWWAPGDAGPARGPDFGAAVR